MHIYRTARRKWCGRLQRNQSLHDVEEMKCRYWNRRGRTCTASSGWTKWNNWASQKSDQLQLYVNSGHAKGVVGFEAPLLNYTSSCMMLAGQMTSVPFDRTSSSGYFRMSEIIVSVFPRPMSSASIPPGGSCVSLQRSHARACLWCGKSLK